MLATPPSRSLSALAKKPAASCRAPLSTSARTPQGDVLGCVQRVREYSRCQRRLACLERQLAQPPGRAPSGSSSSRARGPAPRFPRLPSGVPGRSRHAEHTRSAFPTRSRRTRGGLPSPSAYVRSRRASEAIATTGGSHVGSNSLARANDDSAPRSAPRDLWIRTFRKARPSLTLDRSVVLPRGFGQRDGTPAELVLFG